MRLNSVVMLCFAVAAIAGCNGDDITDVSLPALAGVRLVNGLTEGSAVDIRAMDQIEWSPVANNLSYRNATIHFPTEAGERHLRVFPTSTDASVTSVALHDATITLAADTRVTLLLTGSVAAGTVRFVVINDDITPPAAGSIAVRAVNASSGAIDAYLVTTATDPLPATPTGANIPAQGASPYVARPAGAAAMRVTPAGSATVSASATGPTAPAAPTGTPSLPAAGVNSAGTNFSVYFFPAVAAIPASQGRPAVAATAASAIWLVDRNPAD
jgi:hypothetical protein